VIFTWKWVIKRQHYSFIWLDLDLCGTTESLRSSLYFHVKPTCHEIFRFYVAHRSTSITDKDHWNHYNGPISQAPPGIKNHDMKKHPLKKRTSLYNWLQPSNYSILAVKPQFCQHSTFNNMILITCFQAKQGTMCIFFNTSYKWMNQSGLNVPIFNRQSEYSA